MAADIDELVDELEAEFGDAANALLSAAEYQAHLQRAIAELSQVAPRERVTSVDLASGGREFPETDLSATGIVEIFAVEYPEDETPRRYVQFSRFAGTVEMLIDEEPAAGENVSVYWGDLHEVDGDSSTLPAEYDVLVVAGGAGYAAAQLQLEATNRANVAGVQAVRDWQAFSAAKLREFRAGLRRLRRVRTSRLYMAAQAEPDQSTVVWEP